MIMHCLSSLHCKEVFMVKYMLKEVKPIFFAVGQVAKIADLILAKNSEKCIGEKIRSLQSLVMSHDEYG